MTPDFFETPAALRRWFKTHHASSTELWIGFYKKDSGRGGVIQSAKKTETRDRRLAVLIDCSARGQLVPPFLPRPQK